MSIWPCEASAQSPLLVAWELKPTLPTNPFNLALTSLCSLILLSCCFPWALCSRHYQMCSLRFECWGWSVPESFFLISSVQNPYPICMSTRAHAHTYTQVFACTLSILWFLFILWDSTLKMPPLWSLFSPLTIRFRHLFLLFGIAPSYFWWNASFFSYNFLFTVSL